MKPPPQHGRRLTQREYERAVIALHSQPRAGNAGEDAAVRRSELDLNIDFRLGTAFPQELRDALWQIQQRVEQKRLRLAGSWLVAMFTPRMREGPANRIAQFLLDEYGAVLTPDELKAYFGPVDPANCSFSSDEDR